MSAKLLVLSKRQLQTPPTTNQHFVSVDVLKNDMRRPATFVTPACEGCVPSAVKSVVSHTNPSDLGVVPAAQKYGPHATQGATV